MATHFTDAWVPKKPGGVFVTLRFLLFWGLAVTGAERSSCLAWQDSDLQQENRRKVVLCSTTQIADFTSQIVGDRWEVICVLAAGQDPHTYEVGHDDLLNLMRADLCIQNGWNLEGNNWMGVLAEKGGKPLITCVDHIIPLNLKEVGNQKRLPDRLARDPHAWFDVLRAMDYVRNICDGIVSVDPEYRAEYQLRSENYIRELRKLDCWIREQVNSIPRNQRILVTHHDGFGYFCQAYGFRSITPVGWSTGEFTEVTIDQRQLIIQQIRQLGIKSIFVETSINPSLLTGIARDAGVAIGGALYSDAMGPAGSAEDNYIGMMRYNVQTIVQNLK